MLRNEFYFGTAFAGGGGAQTNKLSLGFFTGVAAAFAGRAPRSDLVPTAVIYDTQRTLSNNGVLGLSWDRMEAASDPFTSYTVYYGNLDTGGRHQQLELFDQSLCGIL